METGLAKRGVVLAVLLFLAIAACWPALDEPAMNQVNAGMTRALSTFAAARALNGAISLAQGTEITAGFGAELTLSVGQVLDPINDLVESFSNVMLLASVAFGIEKVLLAIGQYVYVKAGLVCVLALWGTLYALGKPRPRSLDIALILMLMVRFAVPVVTLGSNAIYEHFLQTEYKQGAAGLKVATETVDATISSLRGQSNAAAPIPAPAPEPQAEGFFSPFRGVFDSINQKLDSLVQSAKATAKKFDPRPYLDTLQSQAAQATQHMIDLIVVFLLQTVLVPLVLVWGMYAALRSALTGAGP